MPRRSPSAANSRVLHKMPSRAPKPRRPRPTSRDYEGTRREILDHARRLYAAGGYGGVMMRAIAHEMGFSARAIYHYFGSKDDLFVALSEEGGRLITTFTLKEEDDPLGALRGMFLGYYEFSKAHPDYFSLMFVDASTPIAERIMRGFRRGGSRISDQRVQRCIDAGIFPKHTAATELRMFLWALVHGPAALRIAQGETGPYFDEFVTNSLDIAIAAARRGLIPRVLTGAATAPERAPARTRTRSGDARRNQRPYRAGSRTA